jgi:hypothetical protein
MARLALDAPRVPPPAEVRRALLARLDATAPRREPAVRRSVWLPWALGMAAAVVAAVWLTAGFVASRYEARIGQMARETAGARERLAQQEAALRAEIAVVELLRDPATKVVGLRGAGPSPEAEGRLVWHEARGGQLFVANLPPPPEGRAYELWTITAGTPRPAGVFQTDATGRGSHRVPAAPGAGPVDVFAVTLEPAGGVPQPTGPIVLASAK